MFFKSQEKKRIYLDHAAATPLRPEVREAMLPFLGESYGNPSAIHAEGVAARAAVEEARQKIATVLGIRLTGVVFTSSGTESNNLAILGLIKRLRRETGREYTDMEVVTSRLEHPSITSLLPILEGTGVTIRYAEVDSEGKISVPALEAVLSPRTVLVTFAYANSEVGVVQNVSRLVRVVRAYEKKQLTEIMVHLDAAQAPLWLPCGLERLGVDMMSLDAGKCGGPKGVGVLALRGGATLLPILYGGGQEQGLRPGTENVASIVGAATAFLIAQSAYSIRTQKVQAVRDEFIARVEKTLGEAVLNGPRGEDRLANNINISLPLLDTEFAVVYLDAHGIAASTKSACAGAGSGESAVVLAMSGDGARAKSTLRLTLGEETTPADMEAVLDVLVQFKQKMSSLT